MKLAWIFLGWSLLLSSPASALNIAAQDSDKLLQSSLEAYKKQNEPALTDYARELQNQNYILAPYADYWLMLLRLSQADNDRVRDFINKYQNFPFADRVRGEWLKKLGKQQDWQTFFAELPNFNREDTAVKCYTLSGRAQQSNPQQMMDVLTEGKPLWMTSIDQPANCNALFDSMFSADVLTEVDIWARFRLALAAGKISLAKTTVKRLKSFDAANLKLVDRAYQNPQQVLQKKQISLKSRYGREINLYAFDRVARTQPDLALSLWQKAQSSFEPAERNYLWGRFALHGARKHDPRALDWFERANDATLDNEQMAWRVRAALRENNWGAVLSAIAAMPPEQQDEGAWRYWKARALKAQQQLAAANAILAPLSVEQNYYGLLAQDELGDVVSAQPVYYKATAEEIKTMMAVPGIQRALELHRLDMRGEAKQEWAWAASNFDDKQLIAAAEVAFRSDWYDVAINTADKTKLTHDFSLRYPTPYRDMMQSYTKENQLDEAWVYGLIRQESRFISYARSGVGASGLMQVMPATAKWIAKRLGIGGFRPAMIHELNTNIQFGTHYLRYTLDQMDGQSLMATAAYNAGPGRPKRWVAQHDLEGAIYAESIPFSETRDYVKKVMANAYFYAQRLGTKVQTLKQRVGVVGGSAVGGVLDEEETE